MNQNENLNDFQNQKSSDQEAILAPSANKPILQDSKLENFYKLNNPFLRSTTNANQNSNFNFNFSDNLHSKKPANNNNNNTNNNNLTNQSSNADLKFLNSKDYQAEINIFELGLSGIKENSLQEITNNNNHLNNNINNINQINNDNNNKSSENAFSSDSLNSNQNTNKDQIINELKSINSTFALWGFNFNLSEFSLMQETFYQRKIVSILKSLLLQKQSDDKANMEKAMDLINLESQRRNFEAQIEKINKNILGSEEKLRRQLHDKDEKIKHIEKKLKEKEDEKTKISVLLEFEKNDHAKAKLRFSQFMQDIKSKEKEIEKLKQTLNKNFNNNNSNSNCNVDNNKDFNFNNLNASNNNSKVLNAISNFGNNKNNKEFCNLKARNSWSFEVKELNNLLALDWNVKDSFCFYINTVLNKGGEFGIENSLKNKVQKFFVDDNKINKNNNNNNILNINNSNYNFNNIANINNNNNSQNNNNLNFFNYPNSQINSMNLNAKENYHNEEEQNLFQKLNRKLFNLRLNAKNDALKTLEILYETLFEINSKLKAFALKKNETKKNLKNKLIGTLGINKDLKSKQEEERKEEEEILKGFVNLLEKENINFFDCNKAQLVKKQILSNVETCEKLYFSNENLEKYQANPEKLIFENQNFAADDFQIILYKNKLGAGYERLLKVKEENDKKEKEKNFANFETNEIANQSFLDTIANLNPLFKFNASEINAEFGLILNNEYKNDSKSKNFNNEKNYFTNLLDELIKKAKENEVKNNNKNNNENNIFSNSNIHCAKDSLNLTESLNLDRMDVVDEEANNKNEKNNNDKNDKFNKSNLDQGNNNKINNQISNSNLEKIFNDFSFNKNYFLALEKASNQSALCGQKNLLTKPLAEIKPEIKIFIRNPAKKLNDKLLENFTNFLYLCIKSNESYIEFFKIFLEEQKINFSKNMQLETENNNNKNIINKNNLNCCETNIKENKYSKMFFYKNFQNMLLNLIDFSDANIRQIHKFYAEKYATVEDKILKLDATIVKLNEVNDQMKENLDFLDEFWQKMASVYEAK